jgi:hypothetical protein
MKVWNKRDKNCPKDAVYVGRPSKWGNPYKIGINGTRSEVLLMYQVDLEDILKCYPWYLDELKGKDLVCWCAPLPCHADILLELVNKGD